jgi:translocation and assembly module TamB
MQRAAKWTLAVLAAPAAALLALGAAAGWLLGTPSGLQWALERAVAASGGRLAIEGAAGALADGFSVDRLSYRSGATGVRASEVSGRLALRALATGTLRLEGLHIGSLEIVPQEKAQDEPPPSDIGLPLRVQVEDARIDRLRIAQGGREHAISDLRFSYTGGPSQHVLRDASANTEWGRATLQASMAAAPPFRIEARAALERAEASASAFARVQPFAERKLETLQLSAAGVDLARFDPALPHTALSVKLEGAGTPGALLAGTLSASNASSGALDAERLPLRSLSARFAVRGETVFLHALQAHAAGGVITGTGELSLRQAELTLALRDVNLRALRSTLRETQLSGKVQLVATEKRQAARGTLSQQGMKLTADVVRVDERVEVRAFRAEAGGGVVSGSGEVRLGEPIAANGSLKFSGFDPSRFGDFPAGVLNGHAEVAGTLSEPRRLQARWTIADSRLAGRSFYTKGRARLDGERLHNVAAQASWGETRATARGALGAPSDRLEWTLTGLEVPSEQFSGRVKATGTARGSLRNPSVAFEASASPVQIADRVSLQSLTARGNGTLRRHELTIAAQGDGFDAQARLRGGWLGDAGWKGILLDLQNAGRYPLQLAGTVPLELSPRGVHLGALRAALGDGALEVKSLDWEPGRLSTSGEFSGLPARWPLVAAGLGDALRSTLRLDGAWSIESTPQLDGRVTLRRSSGDLALTQPAPLELGLGEAKLEARFDAGKVSATLDVASALGELHAQGSAAGMTPDAALAFRARLALEDIRALTGRLPPELRVGGRAVATLEGRGTLGAPELAGSLRADALSVHMPPYGIYLEDGLLRATLEGDSLRIEQLELKGGDGSFTVSGRVPLLAKAAEAELGWRAERFQLVGRPDMRLVLSGKGVAGIENRRLALQGKLRVDRAYIERRFEQLPDLDDDIIVVGETAGETAGKAPAKRAGPPVELDLLIDLGERFKVRQAGFDGLLKGEVHVSTAGEDGELRAFGRIRADDATFRAYGRTLEVDPGEVIFNGPVRNPALQISAWRRNQEVAAGVRITGNLEQPRVELVSEPPLPEGAKLSWLVLGRAPSDASGADLAVLQTAASVFLGRGDAVPVTTRIADAFGLDELSLRGSAELANRVVAVGKRLTDRLYVTYEQGVGAVAQNLVKIDFSLTDRIALRAQTGTTSGAGVYYRFSWD